MIEKCKKNLRVTLKETNNHFGFFWPFSRCLYTHSCYALHSVAIAVVVCLSVTRWYCIETDKDIIKFFSRPPSTTTMVL